MGTSKRSGGLDLVRAIAILSVVGVHFFLNTGFYNTKITGLNMAIQTYAMLSFSICVPLFLMLTGFLQCKKEVSYSFYKGLLPILGVYIFYSLLSIGVREYFFNEHLSIIRWISYILTFRADPYSWYVNMFIGLFLLIPFLNLIIKGLKGASQFRLLIFILVFMTALPMFFNNIKLVFPNWWTYLYPITYYFLGAYVREYGVRIKKIWVLMGFTLVILIETLITLYYSRGKELVAVIGDYGSILIMVSTFLFFLVFYDIDIKISIAKKTFRWIAVLSFDIYLCSYITDKFVYKYVLEHLFKSQQQIFYYYFVPIVLMTFASAAVIALMRYLITQVIKKNFGVINAKYDNKYNFLIK